MKTTSYIVALTICAAAKAMALDHDQLEQNYGDAKATTKVQTVFTVNPFTESKAPRDEGKIDRVGGISSQPWSQTASRYAGASHTMSEMQNQECGLPLLSIGARPSSWW